MHIRKGSEPFINATDYLTSLLHGSRLRFLALFALPNKTDSRSLNSVQSPPTLLIRAQVSVTDGRHNHLTGLSKNNFALLIDDQPTDIALFSDGDEPTSIYIVFDSSDSMAVVASSE